MAVKSAAKVKVTIETAGDHSFDLGHVQREGGTDLIASLLEAAGVDRRKRWRLRIDEKITCTSHTLPIHVTQPKPWCVYIKIKPGDNNTAHRCSLLVPDGSDKGYAKELYEKLKLVEGTVNDEWRGKRRTSTPEPEPVAKKIEEPEMPALADPPSVRHPVHPIPHDTTPILEEELEVELPEEEGEWTPGPERFNAKKLLRDPEQVRLVLFEIYKLSKNPVIQTREHFMDAMRHNMKWQDASKHSTGAIVSSLLKADYLMQVMVGAKIVGYALDEKGTRLVQDLIEKHEAAKHAQHVPPKPAIDTTKVLQSLGKVGEWFHTASKRLVEIATEREMLQEQLDNLNKEEKQICSVVEDPKIQSVLIQLTEVEIKHH